MCWQTDLLRQLFDHRYYIIKVNAVAHQWKLDTMIQDVVIMNHELPSKTFCECWSYSFFFEVLYKIMYISNVQV